MVCYVVIAILKIQYPTWSFSAILTNSEVRKCSLLMNNIINLNSFVDLNESIMDYDS